MSARTAIRRPSARPAALLLPVALAFAGCASVSSYQKAEAQYDRQSQQNQLLARQYSAEIDALKARQAAYQRKLAEESRLNNENAALRQRIAALQSQAGNGPRSAQSPAPTAGFRDLGVLIGADTHALLQKEQRDYAALESLYDRQLKALAAAPAASSQYQQEAEKTRIQALLDVITEALLIADVPGGLLRASPPVPDSVPRDALATLAEAQDRFIVALNEFKLHGWQRSDDSAARALLVWKDLRAANLDIAVRLGRRPSADDQAGRVEALIRITDLALELLDLADRIKESPPSGRQRAAQVLGQYQPVPRLVSSLVPAGARGGADQGALTESEIRKLHRMEWIMTMAAYCQGDSFKAETYLQIRLGEVRPLRAAVTEIATAYERSHPGAAGPKGAEAPAPSKERTPPPEEPYLNSFGP